MKKINFKQFKMFSDIAHEKTVTSDISRQLADLIYKNASGVVALDLAMRIYKAEGEVELNEEEMAFLDNFVTSNTTAVFIDSFRANIHD